MGDYGGTQTSNIDSVKPVLRHPSLNLYRTDLCRCFQSVDVLSLDIIELNESVPHDGPAGRVNR